MPEVTSALTTKVLKYLCEGASNKEIAASLDVAPRTVKGYLNRLFVRFGIKGGYKRVQLALLFSEDEPSPHYLPPHLTDKEIDLSTLVATGMKNKEIGPAVGATEYAIKNCLCVVYDKIGVSGRTELALWWKVYGKAYSQKKGSKCATFTT